MVGEKTTRFLNSPLRWGLFAFFLALGLGVFLLLVAYYWPFVLKNDLRWRDVFFLIFGAIGIGLAVWRSKGADEQIEIAKDALEKSRDQARTSLLQDRYQSAANMLASTSMATRIGGIDILKKMARKESEDYHIQVMELLAAFVCHPIEKSAIEKNYTRIRQGLADGLPVDRFDQVFYYPSDFILAIEAIFNRSWEQKKVEPEDWHINLAYASLYALNMEGFDFTRIELYNANLTKTNLTNATGLKQSELDKTCHLKDRPPILKDAICPDTDDKLTHISMTIIEP